MKHSISIRSRLIKWLTIPLGIFALLIFISIYYILNTKVSTFFDNRLFAIAKSIEQNLGIENSQLMIDFPSFSIDFLSSHDKDLVYYSIIDDDGNLLIGHEGLFDETKLQAQTKTFYNTTYDSVALRVVSYKTFLLNSQKKYAAFITVAETTKERDENIHNMLLILTTIMAVVGIFTILVTLVAVQRGLKPLHHLKNIIKKRDKRDLSPVEFIAPKEIEDVLNSINILLHRSRDNIAYIENFNSDVSHQLRTPLAELKVQIEQTYDKKDQQYHAFMHNIDSMKHLMHQLLLYSRSNPNNVNLERFQKIELNAFAKEYALRIAPKIYEKGFEFTFDTLKEKHFIHADVILLESMLDNIIENALKYAVDSNNKAIGTIFFSLHKEANDLCLTIKDEGSGLEESCLEKIFTRSYRVDTSKKGTGLGLSIVKQIAFLHNATVKASNDNGLKVTIYFSLE